MAWCKVNRITLFKTKRSILFLENPTYIGMLQHINGLMVQPLEDDEFETFFFCFHEMLFYARSDNLFSWYILVSVFWINLQVYWSFLSICLSYPYRYSLRKIQSLSHAMERKANWIFQVNFAAITFLFVSDIRHKSIIRSRIKILLLRHVSPFNHLKNITIKWIFHFIKKNGKGVKVCTQKTNDNFIFLRCSTNNCRQASMENNWKWILHYSNVNSIKLLYRSILFVCITWSLSVCVCMCVFFPVN